MRYILRRVPDGMGDTGSLTVYRCTDKIVESLRDTWPKVGDVVQVGALRATMFGSDTWWRTTRVEEIISATETKMVFRTTNSVYELEVIS